MVEWLLLPNCKLGASALWVRLPQPPLGKPSQSNVSAYGQQTPSLVQ